MTLTQQENRMVVTSLEKLRALWSQYHPLPQAPPQDQPHKQKRKVKKSQRQQQIKGDFHYDCPHCNEPILYNQYWFDDFQNRYIPLSAYTYRPHKCYHKEAEKKESFINGLSDSF